MECAVQMWCALNAVSPARAEQQSEVHELARIILEKTRLAELMACVEALRETAKRDELAVIQLEEIGYDGPIETEQMDRNKAALSTLDQKGAK